MASTAAPATSAAAPATTSAASWAPRPLLLRGLLHHMRLQALELHCLESRGVLGINPAAGSTDAWVGYRQQGGNAVAVSALPPRASERGEEKRSAPGLAGDDLKRLRRHCPWVQHQKHLKGLQRRSAPECEARVLRQQAAEKGHVALLALRVARRHPPAHAREGAWVTPRQHALTSKAAPGPFRSSPGLHR